MIKSMAILFSTLFLGLLGLFLSACAKWNYGEPIIPPPPPPPPKVNYQRLIKNEYYQIIELKEANNYRLKLTPPAGTKSITREKIPDLEVTQIDPLYLTDEKVKPGATYRYTFDLANGALENTIAIIPQDFEIKDRYELSYQDISTDKPLLTTYRRIFLTATGSLVTKNLNVRINAEKFYAAAGSQIVSFDSTISQSTHGPGLSAGTVSISAVEASGTMAINLNGQRGSEGRASNYVFQSAAAQGKLWCLEAGVSCSSTSRPVPSCSNHDARKGGPGENGQDGKPGENGKSGGSGGTLVINKLFESQVNVAFQAMPGEGGLGGQGSFGQIGGPGGWGETVFELVTVPVLFQKYCTGGLPLDYSTLPNGAPGANGKFGPTGLTGEAGQPGQFCLETLTSLKCEIK